MLSMLESMPAFMLTCVIVVDPAGGFLVAASGDRGWQGESTKVVLVHEIKW